MNPGETDRAQNEKELWVLMRFRHQDACGILGDAEKSVSNALYLLQNERLHNIRWPVSLLRELRAAWRECGVQLDRLEERGQT